MWVVCVCMGWVVNDSWSRYVQILAVQLKEQQSCSTEKREVQPVEICDFCNFDLDENNLYDIGYKILILSSISHKYHIQHFSKVRQTSDFVVEKSKLFQFCMPKYTPLFDFDQTFRDCSNPKVLSYSIIVLTCP